MVEENTCNLEVYDHKQMLKNLKVYETTCNNDCFDNFCEHISVRIEMLI